LVVLPEVKRVGNVGPKRGSMMMKIQIICVALCILSLVAFTKGQDARKGGEAPENRRAIRTPEQALEQALAYAGFGEMEQFSRPDPSACATTASVFDSITPFLSEEVSGEDRWVVTFDSVYLDLDTVWSELNHARQLKKTFRFYLEPGTGRLLKIVGRYNWEDSDIPPVPPAGEIERFFKAIGESYPGLVDDVPPISFHQALANVRFVQPLGAEELYAWLVMDASQGKEPHPCWVIVGRGVPPIYAIGPGTSSVSSEDRLSITCFMCKVDAATGTGLGCRSASPLEPGGTD
jgi:hypothetical protein